MLEELKKEITVGEHLKVFLISGKEPEGILLEISDTFIKLKTIDDKVIRLFEKIIGGWEVSETNKHNETEISKEDGRIEIGNNAQKTLTEKFDKKEKEIIEDKIIIPKPKENKKDSEIGEIDTPLKHKTSEKKYRVEIPRPKPIGKIDLTQFQNKKKLQKSNVDTHHIKLIRASKNLKTSTADVVDLANQLDIKLENKSNAVIEKSDFEIIKNYHEQVNNTSEVTNTDNSSKATNNSLKLSSLDGLKKLKNKLIIEEGKQLLPPNGYFKSYGTNKYGSSFGFITSFENKDYFFRFDNVEDSELKTRLVNSSKHRLKKEREKEVGTQIICRLSEINGKYIASNIRLPKQIDTLFQEAETFLMGEDFKSAQNILVQILDAFPDYIPAKELIQSINSEYKRKKKNENRANTAYYNARKAFQKGNIEDAKGYFEEALDLTDRRVESVIKQLAYIYQREGNSDKSIKLVLEHINKFTSTDPNSFIAFFYESDNKYEKALEYFEKVKPGSVNDNIKLKKRKSIAYYRLGQFEKTKDLIKEVLETNPEDKISQSMLDQLEKIKTSDGSNKTELENIFNEAQLVSYSGGLSPFTLFSLDRCQYEGVSATVVQDESFTKKTLKDLRSLIDNMGRKRPKDRASYLLSEAKLVDTLDPDDDNAKNRSIRGYYTALVDSSCIENQPVDVVRFYLLQAVSASRNMDEISAFLPVYFYSFIDNSNSAHQQYSTGINDSLNDCISDKKDEIWLGLLDLFSKNSNVFSTILTRLFSSSELKSLSVNFLNLYLNESHKTKIPKKDFSSVWSRAVDKRKLHLQTLNSQFLSIQDSISSEQFCESFNKLKDSKIEGLSQFERLKIKSFTNIIDDVFEFNRQYDFEDRERYNNQIANKITEFTSNVEENPTDFSFNTLRVLAQKLSIIIQKEFEKVKETSSPEFNIRIAGEGIISNGNNVSFQVLISNKRGSAPVSHFEIQIIENSDVKFLPTESDKIARTLKGGEETAIKLNVMLTDAILDQGTTNINLKCIFKVRGSEEEQSFTQDLALRFYSENDFEQIENPFASTADSGPVTDAKMFFGRDEFLQSVSESIIGSGSKCIIIYGQKRSGKSSVLHHLNKKLTKDDNSLCIKFSLGEIIEDLSAEVFYYKILSEIEDTLDILREKDNSVPEFTSPTISELFKAPSIVFDDYLKKLKKSLNYNEQWKDKKLVLLLDEFTYVYTAIKREILSDQFMKSWKSFLEKGHFTSVLIGQDIMPKFTKAYPNEFGVTEPRRLSYLNKRDAKELIEKPVWDKTRDRSRFIGNALELILDYTSSNPYYIQIFCARLIENMNRNKAISATEVDIKEIANSFVSGADAFTADKFDNLITAGDAEVDQFSPKEVLIVLKQIAVASKNLQSCSRESIVIENNDNVDVILNDLKTREVIECPQPNFYKIKVRLFKEWLLNN